eukprot:Gb_36561 [translate_table: standard]
MKSQILLSKWLKGIAHGFEWRMLRHVGMSKLIRHVWLKARLNARVVCEHILIWCKPLRHKHRRWHHGGVEVGPVRGRLEPPGGGGGGIIGPPSGGGGMLDMGPPCRFEGVDWGCEPPCGGGTLEEDPCVRDERLTPMVGIRWMDGVLETGVVVGWLPN